jgi:hypothetical protein
LGYCTVDNVASAFRFFQRNLDGSPSDSDIRSWIDDRKSRIRSALLRRGFDPDNPPQALTTDQTNFLRSLNRDGAIADLGNALQSSLTLQPGEYSLASSHRKTYETVLTAISKGEHDFLFGLKPMFGGIAGAETDPRQTPASANQNRFFGRSQVF